MGNSVQQRGTCLKCHTVNGVGKEVGPNLSEIGDKFARDALYESILFPSAAIAHNYETYRLELESGNVVTGILVSQTPEQVSIKTADAIVQTYKRGDVASLTQLKISLMPADLQKLMSTDDLVNVVEYLTTLKKARPKTRWQVSDFRFSIYDFGLRTALTDNLRPRARLRFRLVAGRSTQTHV